MSKNNKNRKLRRYKKYIKNFPCENCITLPICKARYESLNEHDNQYYRFSAVTVIGTISDKCSLLSEYLDINKHNNESYGSSYRELRSQRKWRKQFQKLRDKEKIIHKYFQDLILK